MNKRFLSAMLAIVLCFAVCVTSFADVTLMATITVADVKEQTSNWLINQFGEMTEDQLAVLGAAYAKYQEQGTQEIIEGKADALVDGLLGANENFFKNNDSLKDLYKWKLMRDIKDGLDDVQISGSDYEAWLADFTAFEEDNDKKVSLRDINGSLNGLGAYSSDLTEYFRQFSDIAAVSEVTGADARKAVVYSEKCRAENSGGTLSEEMQAEFDAYLKADCEEVLKDLSLNIFDIIVKVGTGAVMPKNGDNIMDMLETKNLKGFFLFFGEDYVRLVINSKNAVVDEIQAMDKKAIVADVLAARGTDMISASNSEAIDAMYAVTVQVTESIINKGVASDLLDELRDKFGFTYEEHFDDILTALREGLGVIEPNHGVELIHFNTYMGRSFLRPLSRSGVEVKTGEVSLLQLNLSHKRAFLANALEGQRIADFDMTFEANAAFTATLGETIGDVYIDATAASDGDTAKVYIYRGTAEYNPGADVEDVYRYVGYYTVSAVGEATEPSSEATEPSSEATEPSSEATEPTSEPTEPTSEPENPYITLDDVADTTADGTVTIKGTTNLPYVTVLITKVGDDKPIYTVVYTKDKFEEGITLKAPDNAKAGNEYVVIAGTERAVDTDTFKILGEEKEYYVTLDDVADTTANGTVTIKGTTNLPYVTVLIPSISGDPKDGPIYAVVYSKGEFERGIELKAPAGAEVDDVYAVIVGTEKAVDTKTFTIIEGGQGPTEPSSEVTEPSSEVTEPSSEATEPSSEATEPSSETTEPSEAVTLALTGSTSRSVVRNKTIVITTTPQSAPEGAYVSWTVADTSIAEVASTAGDYGNLGTIKGIKKGKTTVTATLYDKDGKVLDSKEITLTVTSGGTTGGIDVKPTEPTSEPTEPTSEPDTGKHKCEWPDIAATATGSAHWAHETIDIMTINGYVNGYPDGLFRPDQFVTRAEFSAFVYRILGLRPAEDGVEYDDTTGHWAEGIIGTMSLPEGYGMLRGYGDGNFGPNDLITREQAIAIIARAKSAVWAEAEEGAKDVFSDAEDISWWFNGEVDAAVTNGLVEGYEDGSFKPLSYTTRAEACVLLARAWPEVLETASTAEE